MNPIAMTLVLVSTLGFFSWTASRRWRQLMVGQATNGAGKFSFDGGELVQRLRDLGLYVFGQFKMTRNEKYRAAGVAHAVIFYGFVVLGLNSLMLWIRGYSASFDFWGLLAKGSFLGDVYGFSKDVFLLLVILGASVFIFLRAVKKEKRMTLKTEGLVILGIIITMMVSDLLYSGASFALAARLSGEALHFHPAEFASSATSFILSGIESDAALTAIQHFGFWTHASLVLIFLNILPFSKHFHIITVIPNVFTRDRNAAALPPVEDLEGKVEREESLGIDKVTDLTWKHILDLYTCTECGRCSDNCPAYTTDKKLSPKHVTIALRDHLYATELDMFGGDSTIKNPSQEPPASEGDEQKEIYTFPAAPAEAYYQSEKVVELVPNIIDPDVLWACTTCRACEEQCPVMISYVDKIVGMRRELVMMKSEFPAELQRAFQGIETNGNPWNSSAMDRDNWASGLEIPVMSDNPSADVLYWVGCAASYDDRAKKVARSVAQLLQHAGVNFAILGTEETCTGDPARRAGNEYLFQMLAEQNVETLNNYGCEKKTIITACPHCFNTLANEYPDFGGKFEVVHHSEYLLKLVAEKKIVPEKQVNSKIAYHDSCYLGRYNDVYDAPREILKGIPGVDVVEVPYWNRSKGLCCGAGGAQYFMEEQNENKVNVKRTLQLVDTGCDTIASGCPFCSTMLTDGLKDQEKDEQIQQLDLAEILAQSVVFAKAESSAAE